MSKPLDELCMICGKQERLVVDYNYETGKLRGLLCCAHKTGLGIFQDNPDLLDKAATYLREQGHAEGLVPLGSVNSTYRVDYEPILQLLIENPEKSHRAVARLYQQVVACSEDCAQRRVSRVAKKHGIRSPRQNG